MRAAARPDPIRIVEAAYAWEPDETRWLDEVVRAAAPYDVGGGVVAYTVGIAEATTLGAVSQTDQAGVDLVSALSRGIENLPPDLAREMLAPTEFVGNSAYRLSRLARARRGGAAAQVQRSRAELPTVWALICGDPRVRSLALCFPRAGTGADDEPFPHRDARSLGLVGAHLSAALRLRTLVHPPARDGIDASSASDASRAPGTASAPAATSASATSASGASSANDPSDAGTEAVLTPGGKVLHATGEATSAGARASLAEAVRASETARGRMRRSSPDEAIGLWTALVQGRWTIIDSAERGGKRILLARKNPLRGGTLLDLTADERDVAWLAAQGHSYKYIGYELGVPLSTVAGRLRRAMHKLRIRSRTELLRKLGAAAREQ